MEVIFFSKNNNKRKEMKRIFKELSLDINIQDSPKEIKQLNELQQGNIDDIIKHKLKETYKLIKRPVLVEHTVLQLDCLNGYPNTQTDLFWETLKSGKICKITELFKNKIAIVKTMVAYCDGKNIITGEGEVKGRIADAPAGDSEFQWDTIFIPDDKDANNKTFAELESEGIKDRFSMRKKAIEDFYKKFNKLGTKIENIGLDSSVIKEIVEKINDDKMILFIGAGVSKNAGMPTWSQLIELLGEELGYKDRTFSLMGDFLELAEYYQMEKEGNLESVKNFFHNVDVKDIEGKIKKSKIYCSISNMGIKNIYTTNYDDLIERAFNIHNYNKKYDVIYNLETLTKAKEENIHIIKLHGDFRDINNIVLTQTSYFDRYDFENCLDIKLRSDMLTKSILFIGYSFNDSNIKYMFHKLNKLWSSINVKERPKSYIFLTENNPIQRRIMERNNMVSIVSDKTDKSKALEEFLEEILKRK